MPTVPGLAVLLDDGTGTFPTDITNKVLAMDGYEITRGRDDWQGAVTAGELTLTLNNSDGRFTPGSTILGSPSPIKVDQRIRLKETVNGVTYTRFTGYVKSWPVAWPATVPTFSTVQLTATDAQARVERRTLRSMIEEEVALDSPTAYFTLGEAEGSTSAGDTSGNENSTLTPAGSGSPLTFGAATGVSGSDLTGVAFNAGEYMTGPLESDPTYMVLAVVSTTAPTSGTDEQVLFNWGSETFTLTHNGVHLWSRPTIDALVSAVSLGPATLTWDGTPHLVGFAVSASLTHGYRVYLDASATSAATATVGAFTGSPLTIGQALYQALFVTMFDLTATVSNIIILTGAVLTDTEVASLSTLVTGANETADARVSRLASYAGITTGVIDTSSTVVPAQDTSGRSAQDALQEVVDAELGLVFIDGSGSLTFHNRSRVVTKTTPDLILDSQYVTPDVQPVVDDQNIVNYVEATAAGTGSTQVVQNTTSESTHGRYPESVTYLVQTDSEALERANWIVAKQAEPTLRYGTLTINLYKMTAAMAANVVSTLDLGCWLRVTSLASQNPGGTIADVVVQGWDTQATGESWSITCNVTSRSLEQAALWDDSNSTWDTAVWFI